jgi:hypothetical protein
LCDVAPEGASRRVSYGVLNLTHRDGHSEPAPLEPGRFYTVRVKLNDCGHAFAEGHVVRLALSSAYWPLLWPAPEAATLTVRGPAHLTLPRRRNHGDERRIAFEPPDRGREAPATQVADGGAVRVVSIDLRGGTATYVTDLKGGVFGEGTLRLEEADSLMRHDIHREFRIGLQDPLTASYALDQIYEMGREGWHILINTRTSMRATATSFDLEGTLEAFENGTLAASRRFTQTVPRDLV